MTLELIHALAIAVCSLGAVVLAFSLVARARHGAWSAREVKLRLSAVSITCAGIGLMVVHERETHGHEVIGCFNLQCKLRAALEGAELAPEVKDALRRRLRGGGVPVDELPRHLKRGNAHLWACRYALRGRSLLCGNHGAVAPVTYLTPQPAPSCTAPVEID